MSHAMARKPEEITIATAPCSILACRQHNHCDAAHALRQTN